LRVEGVGLRVEGAGLRVWGYLLSSAMSIVEFASRMSANLISGLGIGQAGGESERERGERERREATGYEPFERERERGRLGLRFKV